MTKYFHSQIDSICNGISKTAVNYVQPISDISAKNIRKLGQKYIAELDPSGTFCLKSMSHFRLILQKYELIISIEKEKKTYGANGERLRSKPIIVYSTTGVMNNNIKVKKKAFR